jgi:GTPase Era involved in 16S rRNA processing
MSSEALVPNCYVDVSSNKVYWDCPGFKENRGGIQEIVNSFYIRELFKNLKNIKIVMLVTEQSL